LTLLLLTLLLLLLLTFLLLFFRDHQHQQLLTFGPPPPLPVVALANAAVVDRGRHRLTKLVREIVADLLPMREKHVKAATPVKHGATAPRAGLPHTHHHHQQQQQRIQMPAEQGGVDEHRQHQQQRQQQQQLKAGTAAAGVKRPAAAISSSPPTAPPGPGAGAAEAAAAATAVALPCPPAKQAKKAEGQQQRRLQVQQLQLHQQQQQPRQQQRPIQKLKQQQPLPAAAEKTPTTAAAAAQAACTASAAALGAARVSNNLGAGGLKAAASTGARQDMPHLLQLADAQLLLQWQQERQSMLTAAGMAHHQATKVLSNIIGEGVTRCIDFLLKLDDEQLQGFFLEDAAESVAGYADEVEHPMCLQMMEQALNKGRYQVLLTDPAAAQDGSSQQQQQQQQQQQRVYSWQSLYALAHDVQLLLSNAKQYNEPRREPDNVHESVLQYAQLLQTEFAKYWLLIKDIMGRKVLHLAEQHGQQVKQQQQQQRWRQARDSD
jgi:hypothetical protein